LVNYVQLDRLIEAAHIIAGFANNPEERHRGAVPCSYEPDAPESLRACGEPAVYFVPDATRASAGGDIEQAPQYYCREHLEEILGEPPPNSRPLAGSLARSEFLVAVHPRAAAPLLERSTESE